ncbi:MAG: hypothetical protein IKP61_01710 [Spirochaetales bacterium]|jgi:hypothetical protein|nr:hypothetical protein [Spirochaetales bacterium]
MGKGSHKISGFLWALIIAVVSFFIIFLFFPDVSYKFFGVSVRQPVGKTVSEAAGKMADKVSDTVSDAVSSAVSNAVSDISDAVTDAVSDAVSNISTK